MSMKCDQPCATCPFLTENFGRENPTGFEAIKAKAEENGEKLLDWYSEKNLTRLWRDGLRKGEAMICHSSDPNASTYGYDGKTAVKGHEKICTGALLTVFLHIKYLERLITDGFNPKTVQEKYRASAGKYPMTKNGQAVWVMNFAFGRASFPYGLEIPRSINGKSGQAISLPWQDQIVNGK